MKFEIGMQVVAIKNHSDGIFKMGDIFTILNVRNPSCKCRDIELDIGVQADKDEYSMASECTYCGVITKEVDYTWWVFSKNFVPLQQYSFKQVTWEKITEEIPCCAH